MNYLKKKNYLGGALLIVAAMVANFLNFAFNAYLGRVLDLKEFGLISLVGSFYTFSTIGFNALASVVNYQGGFLIGRYGMSAGNEFLRYMQRLSFIIAIIFSVLWILLIPFLSSFLHTTDILFFASFTPVLFFGFTAFINRGFISSKLQFGILGVIVIAEPAVKLLSTILLVQFNLSHLSYLAIPFSIIGILISTQFVLRNSRKNSLKTSLNKVRHFPKEYFLASIISGLAALSFATLDVVLARHYLNAEQAGQYALVSLVGKMVFFMAGLSSQFVTPLISRYEGQKKDSSVVFYKILFATILLSLMAFIPLGLLAPFFVPALLGTKTEPILKFLPLFLFAMMAFSVSRIFVTYYQVKKRYIFPVAAFLVSLIQIFLINSLHRSVDDIVNAMVFTGILNLIVMVILHVNKRFVRILEFNIGDLLELFVYRKNINTPAEKLDILIFNWRDRKHKWGGGAETYIHELAKRWVSDGNKVTIFCGNDYENKKNETIDGINIIRRGGFYTMYLWAPIYYLVKFRGKFDVIIDSENGIPFFSPLFSRKPIFLLIHHVHQEVFLAHLRFPLAQIARCIEGKFMPFVYRNKNVITVSESSKRELLKLGFTNSDAIRIVNPGIETEKFKKLKKTKEPSFLYIGRLKPYKNIDVAIKAFSKIHHMFPNSKLHIAGEGESELKLKKLSRELKITKSVLFHGKVSDRKKSKLLAKSWAAIQPSMVEGWGITVIEANASGTPVVASNVNGLNDSIIHKKTGLLVKPSNTNELASALIKIINSESFRKSISKRAFYWSKNFDWTRSSNAFYPILLEAVREKKVRRYTKILSFSE